MLGRIGRLEDLAQLGHGLQLLVRSRTEPSLVGRALETTVINQTLVSLNMPLRILLLLVVLLLKILLFLFVIVFHRRQSGHVLVFLLKFSKDTRK